MLTFTSIVLAIWNLSPPDIKQLILCFVDLYHFSNVHPAVRYFCKLHRELVNKSFIDRLIGSRSLAFGGCSLSSSPALGAFLHKLSLPTSSPIRSLLLIHHRFPIATALTYQMAQSQPARDIETFTRRVNTLTPGVILLCNFFEQYRAKSASFVTNPTNPIYFSNASPENSADAGKRCKSNETSSPTISASHPFTSCIRRPRNHP